jgi:hypothetical protein
VQVGNVWINSHGSVDAGVPFAGWKQSGAGVVGGKEGITAMVESLELDTCRVRKELKGEQKQTFLIHSTYFRLPAFCSGLKMSLSNCTYFVNS